MIYKSIYLKLNKTFKYHFGPLLMTVLFCFVLFCFVFFFDTWTYIQTVQLGIRHPPKILVCFVLSQNYQYFFEKLYMHRKQIVWEAQLRGYCTSYPKKLQNKHVLCSISTLSKSFWKIIYASYSKLSKELKNSIKMKVGQAVLELLIQKQHFNCFDL